MCSEVLSGMGSVLLLIIHSFFTFYPRVDLPGKGYSFLRSLFYIELILSRCIRCKNIYRYLSISNTEKFTRGKDSILHRLSNGDVSAACLTFLDRVTTTMYCLHPIWRILNWASWKGCHQLILYIILEDLRWFNWKDHRHLLFIIYNQSIGQFLLELLSCLK